MEAQSQLQADTPPKGKGRQALRGGTAILWPADIEARYGISPATRWRWERDDKLPKRDMKAGGRTGWKPSTIEKSEQRQE